MAGFHEVQLPTNISRGARGGPRRKTQIVMLASGDEERNASWASSRRAYDISYGIRSADVLATVVAFFEARNGQLYGFRFKDWSDYKSCLPSETIGPNNQRIGTGNGVTRAFQIIKNYTSGDDTWARTITKPVAASVVSALGNFDVDAATGIITFDDPPGNGVAVKVGFEFDVPVRFDTDMIDVALSFERSGSIASIPLIELRR
jgi:uncharacterized protein (TIGR02217 family)